jgi:polyisoprenoid-binding protein YceI
MNGQSPQTADVPTPARTRWRIDPERSSVEFRVPHFYGLLKVKGRFERYTGTLDLSGEPTVELTIDADSVQTKQKARDKHLRSPEFFNTDSHPHVRFTSHTSRLAAGRLHVEGHLEAAGHTVPLQLEAVVRPVGDELEIVAETAVDQHELGMTWSPLGITRTPSTLIVKGRLVKDS